MTVLTERGVFQDLRGFLDRLRDIGAVREIDRRVDSAWEVGAICRENNDRGGPALIFNHVDDYQTPLVVGVLGTLRQYAAALNMEPNLPTIAQRWRDAYREPIPPREVQHAPCKEVVTTNIDLTGEPFPVPLWHKLDAGRELGTLHAVVSRDPETGWLNLGAYRNQILERDKLGCNFTMYRHIGRHWLKYREMGKPLPVAIAIGLDPRLILASVTEVPSQVSEYDIAGGLSCAPIEVVKAELSDLVVPASAEIIIEGEIPTDRTYPMEAPFGEFGGCMGEPVPDARFIEVKLISHRRQPFFQGTLEGRPPSESALTRSIGRSMTLLDYLHKIGSQGVVDVAVTIGGCAGYHAVVALKKQYPGHVQDVMSAVFGHPNMFVKNCVIVDETVDPRDPVQVEWAVCTRVQGSRDIRIIPNGRSTPLDTSQVPSRRGWSDLIGIDATTPSEYYAQEGATFPDPADPPGEWVAQVRARWREYGLE
jgi:4-hydroxy-3-polyprenylbenzoate decarboxylase